MLEPSVVVRFGKVTLVLAGPVTVDLAGWVALVSFARVACVVFSTVVARVPIVVVPSAVVPLEPPVVRVGADSRVLRSPGCCEVLSDDELEPVRSPPSVVVRFGKVTLVLAGPVTVDLAGWVALVSFPRVACVVFSTVVARVPIVVLDFRSKDLHTGLLFPSLLPVLCTLKNHLPSY